MSMKLFTPASLGSLKLRNRIVMAPMTRNRAGADAVPSPSAPLYYAQRSTAGLIVSEGTCISPEGVGDRRIPGLWSEEQIRGWKPVTDAVHGQGSLIVAQLWHTGRASHPALQPGGKLAVAPSAIAIRDDRYLDGDMVPHAVPRALELPEIKEIGSHYARAARNAIEAGFDGVELHGANGYLIDQFLQDASNQRTDEYGGPIENRVRFLREVLQVTTEAIGADRVGLRISPSSTFQSMSDSDPAALWTRVLEVISEFDLAYLHVVEPGISGSSSEARPADSIDSAWVRKRYSGKLITAGEYTRERADAAIGADTADAIGFGRLFVSNPDLPKRFAEDALSNEPNRDTFYQGDDIGYIDQPSLEAEELLQKYLDEGAAKTDVVLSAETRLEDWPKAWALQQLKTTAS